MVAVWEQRDPAFTTTLVQRLVQQDGRYHVAETVDVLFGADSGGPAADSSDAFPTDSDDAPAADSGDCSCRSRQRRHR